MTLGTPPFPKENQLSRFNVRKVAVLGAGVMGAQIAFGSLPYDMAHMLGGAMLTLSFALLYQRRISAVINIYAMQGIVLAAAAFFRIGAYTGNIESSPLIGYLLAWGPIWGWLGAAVILTMAWSLTRRQPA